MHPRSEMLDLVVVDGKARGMSRATCGRRDPLSRR